MAISNKLDHFEMIVNHIFTERAESLKPALRQETVTPVPSHSEPLKKGDKLLLDFCDHHVGFLSFAARSVGSPMDAPAKLRVRYAELPFELEEDWDSYHGEVSSSWLQEEIHFLDQLPAKVDLPRRHAFRYVEILVMDVSPKYQIVLEDISCCSVSSADYSRVPPVQIDDPELAELDRVSLRTMHQCMQSVFEDGPKRDRRLWLGDLRLQALGNYCTFRNNNLVKRCLYLFAGLTVNEGRVGAALFHEPVLQVDDTVLFDYTLFFVSALHDYYAATGDRDTLETLYPTALHQIELSLKDLDEHHVVRDRDGWWCFLDWGDGLNKQAGAHAILIYAVKQLRTMSGWLGMDTTRWDAEIAFLTEGALSQLWDNEQGFFISGAERQVSWASQIWFVLADILTAEQNARLLKHLLEVNPSPGMVTPYMYHHYVQALLQCGMKQEAITCLKDYWGEMIRDGADTFFEVYDPKNKSASPYGGRIINSFCHAWSGTPSYFIRSYFLGKTE